LGENPTPNGPGVFGGGGKKKNDPKKTETRKSVGPPEPGQKGREEGGDERRGTRVKGMDNRRVVEKGVTFGEGGGSEEGEKEWCMGGGGGKGNWGEEEWGKMGGMTVNKRSKGA